MAEWGFCQGKCKLYRRPRIGRLYSTSQCAYFLEGVRSNPFHCEGNILLMDLPYVLTYVLSLI